MSGPSVDYYKVLEVDAKANAQQIREAYKKAALKHHPDRVPVDSPERPRRTKKFQQINDAYYTLSDPTRRRDYDESRRYSSFTSSSSSNTNSNTNVPGGFDYDEEVPRPNEGEGGGGGGASSGFFSNFPWSTFGFGGSKPQQTDNEHNTNANSQFGSIFEEMMRENGMADSDPAGGAATPNRRFWSVIGGVSGGAMGFIVANLPGMAAGATAGTSLGAVRDRRGKSVYNVFKELPQGERAKLLSELAAKVFAHAVSG